jgi:hypothetical protein
MEKIKDLTSDIDCRGDYAFFIEYRHVADGNLDATTKNVLHGKNHPIFFRVIRNGVETSSHGWIENGEIVQWG